MGMRIEYAVFSGIIIVILLLTGVFTFSDHSVQSEDQEITVVFGLELDSLIILATSILAGILFIISTLAYLKDTRVPVSLRFGGIFPVYRRRAFSHCRGIFR